jgi:Peptidase_C39 like family
MEEQPLQLVPLARPSMGQREPYPTSPLPGNLVSVPSVKQRTDFSCGNAATLAVLRFWLRDAYAHVDEAALYLPLETTRARGTEPEPIAAFLKGVAGLEAEYRYGDVTIADLERAIDARQPPIVDLQAWSDDDTPWRDVWDAGHYVVMVGYDAHRLFFMDPGTLTPGPYAYLPRSELDERWHDLAGAHDDRVERMAIFVRGTSPTWPAASTDESPGGATKMG